MSTEDNTAGRIREAIVSATRLGRVAALHELSSLFGADEAAGIPPSYQRVIAHLSAVHERTPTS